VRATAPQFCGLKILRDGIHGRADLRCSVHAFDEVGGEALGGVQTRRNSSAAALAGEPLMVVFQTARLRRGVQMFRATRLNADDRQITAISQQVLSSERPINHQRC
jgi:hypothetical protein